MINEGFWKVIRKYQSATFEWGKFDCAVLVMEVVSLSRPDFTETVKTRYGTWASALQAARTHRKGLLQAAVDMLGEPSKITFAKIGDVGLFELDGEEAMCVYDGVKFIAPCQSGGFQKIPNHLVKHIWSL